MDNKKLKEVGILLSKCVNCYKRASANQRSKVFNEIINLCHTYVYFYTVNYLNEDDMAEDFSQFIIKNLGNSIKTYDIKKGDFASFINSYMLTGFRLFKSKKYRSSFAPEILEDALNRDESDFYHYDTYRCEAEQNNFKKIKLRKKDKSRILAFILTMARAMDENSITRINALLEMDEDCLKKLIYKAISEDNDKNNKEEKINKSRSLRNLYYLRLLKLKRLNLNNSFSQSDIALLNKYKKMVIEHNKKIAKYSYVSQKIVANLLDLDYKMIRSDIFRAKKLLEDLCNKGYF